MSFAKNVITDLASQADITINGDEPWDVQVHDEQLYKRILHQGSLGLGEAYVDNWWDCASIDEMMSRIISTDVSQKIQKMGLNAVRLVFNKLNVFDAFLINRQTKKRALVVGREHYDIGNDLYHAMLDTNMVYTSAYWKDATTLDEAQEAKLKLVCDKIYLKPGQKVLDIGCGWGSFAKYAAENYGASVVGVTISKEQADLAKSNCEGLPVEIRMQDYRDINESFDHIISLGMFEHVGHKNFQTYFNVAARCLKDDGLFLLHTIGNRQPVTGTDPWIGKYIFPNSMIPSLSQIAIACESKFVIEDVHNFGSDYDKTLMAWFHNFDANWEHLQAFYDPRFYRLWKYYLLSCAGTFRCRDLQLFQLVLSKDGVKGGYQSIR
jgi:cyclopropane-fatty-acyl-phospholipid synthase